MLWTNNLLVGGSLDGEGLETRLAVSHLLCDVLETLCDGVLGLVEVLLHEHGAYKLVHRALALDELELLHHELVLGLLCHQRLALPRDLLDLLLHRTQRLHLLLKLPQTGWIHALSTTLRKKRRSQNEPKNQEGNTAKEEKKETLKMLLLLLYAFFQITFFPVDSPLTSPPKTKL